LQEKNEKYKEKLEKSKETYDKVNEELEKIKTERYQANNLVHQTISKYEKTIKEMKDSFEKELSDFKKREEEYMNSNSNLLESDIYAIYKEIQEKFESKLKENVNLKGQNDKINDEIKFTKYNLQNNESVLNECITKLAKQTKLIKQYKENLDELNKQIEKKQEDYKKEFQEYNFKTTKLMKEREDEIHSLKNQLKLKTDENYNLRLLSQMILDQRSDIEQFFIESLEEVKQEIYKKKKEFQKKSQLFS